MNDWPRSITSWLALATVCIPMVMPQAASAQDEGPVEKINEAAAAATIKATPLRGGLTMLEGSGGNITVLSTSEGMLMVDAGIAVSKAKVEAALQTLGQSPLRYVIDTHYHWDHTDGNAWAHERGATVVAHENVLKRVSVATRVDDWQFTFPVYSPAGRPTVLTGGQKSISLGGEDVDIRYYGPCHTDGDVWAYFRQADVLATGDTFWNGVYPFIDNENGGSIDGMIRAADANIERAGPRTIVVPGHGPVGNRADLVSFRDMLVTVRDRVAALRKQGKTVDQVIAAAPTRDLDAKWGGYVLDGAFFTRIVYQGLP